MQIDINSCDVTILNQMFSLATVVQFIEFHHLVFRLS